MDYFRIYLHFVHKRLDNEYRQTQEITATHHAYPPWLGRYPWSYEAEDCEAVVIHITRREHIFAHRLIAKFCSHKHAEAAKNVMMEGQKSSRSAQEKFEERQRRYAARIS